MPPFVHPIQALAVYAEPLVARRRVVVFGDAVTGLAARVEELGAHTVQLITPERDLGVLRGARFDLALVADLAQFQDPEELLGRIRRCVGDTGVALVAAANRDAVGPEVASFDYYDLFDLVAREFADVRMIAHLPFYGVALAEIGEVESPGVSVNTQLVDGDRAPQGFVVLASQRGANLDPYAIIELPSADRPRRDDAPVNAARAELAEERRRAQGLAAQIESLEARAERATEVEQELAGRAARGAEAERELAGRAARTTELERDLAARVRQLADLSSEVEEQRAAAEAGRIAAAQVEQLALRADRAERAAARVEPELTRLVDAHAIEHARYEEALRERAQLVRQLEVELVRRERIVLELIDRLGHALPNPAAPAPEPRVDPAIEVALAEENARLRERLDTLALELARREGDAQAGAWTVAELQRRLEQAPHAEPALQGEPAPAPRGSTDEKLAEVMDELDALRKALVQEHEARVRAEVAAQAVDPAHGAGTGPSGPS
jgi:hypothetical protein